MFENRTDLCPVCQTGRPVFGHPLYFTLIYFQVKKISEIPFEGVEGNYDPVSRTKNAVALLKFFLQVISNQFKINKTGFALVSRLLQELVFHLPFLLNGCKQDKFWLGKGRKLHKNKT